MSIHITRTTASGDTYGHSTEFCDPAGCSGHEKYYGQIEGAAEGEVLEADPEVLPIDRKRASEIAREVFAAAGISGRDVPQVGEGEELSDGNHWEPAELGSEEVFRAQCQRWIAAIQ